MTKIIFFIETLAGGGAEKVLLDIVKKLDKDKFDITVKTIVDNGIYDDEIKKYCKYETYINSEWNEKGIIYKLLYYIKYKLIYKLPSKIVYNILFKRKYDVEIAFVEGYTTKIIGSSKRKDIKKLAWVHVDPIERTYADNYYKDLNQHIKSYEVFDKVICVSKSVANSVRLKYKLDYNNLIVQYNPIDKDEIILKSKDYINKNDEYFNIITVGRLVHQKGYDRLLRVVKRLREDHSGFKLVILGDGELKSELNSYIEANDLSSIVSLYGFVNNPYKFIKNSDLFVCSSRAEGFSLVIAEALVLGIPVISTNCSGPNELLDYGKFGMLVENDEEELYKGIYSLMNSKEQYNVLKYKSAERSRWFDYDSVIKQIEKIILGEM